MNDQKMRKNKRNMKILIVMLWAVKTC